MKDRIFCKFEQKEVNIQYYDCPENFNCKKCSRSTQSKVKITRSHDQRLLPKDRKKFSQQDDNKETFYEFISKEDRLSSTKKYIKSLAEVLVP